MCRSFIPVALLIVVFSSAAAATTRLNFDQLKAKSDSLDLANHREWHRLMHYHPVKLKLNALGSHITDSRYFLSAEGQSNSQKELDASLHSLFFPEQVSKTQQDPRCRFVERERWLRGKLNLPASTVPAHCTAYHKWFGEIRAHSVTLVFPASYLNSPSSMFGHTLLRLDPEDKGVNSTWLSYSLNFAADVGADSEYSVGYAFKGIAGGYPGKFNVVPYFQKLQEYGAIENRDIWEYELELTSDEVDRLVNHAWELRDINFSYFFFRENCAFRLLELIDYARPSLTLAEQFKFSAIPADTIKSVANSGIVSDIHYRPSIGTRLQSNISRIPSHYRLWISKLEDQPQLAESDEFLDIEENVRHQLLVTANQMLTYNTRRKNITDDATAKRFSMLKLISSLPVKQSVNPPIPIRPHKSHDTTLVSIGVGREQDVNYSQVTFRATYHDLLDNSAGYLKGAGISLGTLSVRRFDSGDIQLDTFDIVQLRSYGSGHSLFKTISWGVDFGFVRDDALENNRVSLRLRGAAGKSFQFGPNSIVYWLAGPSINGFNNTSRDIYTNVHSNIGILNYNRLGVTQLQIDVDSLQDQPLRLGVAANHNFPLSRNQSIRAELGATSFRHQSNTAFQLSYRYYF